MNEGNTTPRVTSADFDSAATWAPPKTRPFEITGMLGMLVVAVAAALAVGVLSLLITMPGGTYATAQQNSGVTGASTDAVLTT